MSEVSAGQPRLVFGLDALPQSSPLARREPKYALVVVRNGQVIRRDPEVPRFEFMHRVMTEKPDFVAVDNVWELASNVDVLKALVRRLPTKTRIVQVTGPPEAGASLQEVAKRYGIAPPPSLVPVKEAEAAARLGALGAGVEVEVLENETKVLVRRGVSLGPGGSSQARYRRKIHGEILARSKRIRDTLDKLQLDYDVQQEESDYGLERAGFTVYAPRSRLWGAVKPVRGTYVRVEVVPVFRKQVLFSPRAGGAQMSSVRTSSRKLVVGVDPGTTCGLAILSLSEEPLLVTSRRGLTRGDITRMVLELGEPVVVAADVTPVPRFVEKLANSLNSVLFTPQVLLEATEKQQTVSEYSLKHGIVLSDPHERDALAAAVKAYQGFKNKFEQVEAHVRETGARVPLEECKALVVRGHSIREAIELLAPKPQARVKPVPAQPSPSPAESAERLRSRIVDQQREIERLERSNESLSKRIQELESSVEELRSSLREERLAEERKVRRDREVHLLLREVDGLRVRLSKSEAESEGYRVRLEKLKRFRELESRGEVIFLKPVESFTEGGLARSLELYEVGRGDVVYLLNASGGGASAASELARRGVRAVVAGTAMSQPAEETLDKLDIPVVEATKVEIEWAEGYPYVKARELEEAIRGIRRRRAEERVQGIEEMVREYREERKRVSQTE